MKSTKLTNFRNHQLRLRRFPNSCFRLAARDKFLIWECIVRPFYFSGEYKICLNHEIGWQPRVWIVEPDFSKKDNLPHVYRHQTNRLCLYHSDNWQWNESCDIVKTIIAWSQMWIVYYEDYLKEGKWRGPEAEHNVEQIKSDDIQAAESRKKKHNTKPMLPQYLKNFPIRLK